MQGSVDSTVQVQFSLAVGTGRLEATLDVPAGEVTLTGLLPVLQTLSSNIVESTIEIIGTEGYAVSCRLGCAACCRQMVPISIFEAAALADYIRALPAPQQMMLQERFRASLLALRDSGILARMDPASWMEGDHDQLNVDYLAEKVPCPFLIDEACSIHAMRPMICREHLVTSPAEFCADPSHRSVVGVPMPIRLSKLLYRLGAQVEDNPRGWMPLVFLIAWMEGETRPGDVIAGPGPELLYEIVKRLPSA